MLKFIMDFLTFWSKLSTDYGRIASDPERRAKSVRFGVQSILSSVFGAAVVLLCALGVSSLMSDTDGMKALGIVFAALLALIALVAVVQLTVRGLIATVYQMRLNRRPIGIISLVVWILSVIATIVLSVLMIGHII